MTKNSEGYAITILLDYFLTKYKPLKNMSSTPLQKNIAREKICIKNLAETLKTSRPTAKRYIDILFKLGIIEPTINPGDKRYVIYTLSEEWKEKMGELMKIIKPIRNLGDQRYPATHVFNEEWIEKIKYLFR